MDKDVYKHAGQGTASPAFWFEGMYLELIWADAAEVAARKVKEMGTDLAMRLDWAKKLTTSPFGVGLVPRSGCKGDFPLPLLSTRPTGSATRRCGWRRATATSRSQ